MINGHGGNIYDTAKRLGCAPCEIIDMSSNVNPLGPPAGLSEFLKENISSVTALPEADAKSISAAFAKRYGISPECVLAGNGTTQFIYTLPLALGIKKALIFSPTYSDYADACIMHNVPYTHVIAKESDDFCHVAGRSLQFSILHPERSRRVNFICNPNNPTGILIPADTLKQICQSNPDINFIIDESYLPFAVDGDKESMMRSGLSNVIVLHSMSKIFRIPGLRIGFIISSEKITEKLKRYALPWNVSSLAQSAVLWLMERKTETDIFIKDTAEFLESERKRFAAMLKSVSGLKLFPSMTSFILAKLPEGYTADSVCDRLLQERILIRNCSNFKGLSNAFIRISLKTEEINSRLAEKLVNIFSRQ